MLKNTAYAWRQMIFFLSLCGAGEVQAFLDSADARLARQGAELRQRFTPVVAALRAVAAGASFDRDGTHAPTGGRRFLGWSVGRHPLQPSGR